MIPWLKDKEKNGEIFTNSECFRYVLKLFKEEKRVELWESGKVLFKEYETLKQAFEVYEEIKRQNYRSIIHKAEELMK